jgi:hypothetical protein
MKMHFTNEWLRKKIEAEPDDVYVAAGGEPLADDAFYCPRCGDPLPQDIEAERKAREAGMCLLCVAADESSR